MREKRSVATGKTVAAQAARMSASTFGRPAGAMAHALAVVRDRILAQDDTTTN